MPDLPHGCSGESDRNDLEKKNKLIASLSGFFQSNKECTEIKVEMMISKVPLSGNIVLFPSNFWVMELNPQV